MYQFFYNFGLLIELNTWKRDSLLSLTSARVLLRLICTIAIDTSAATTVIRLRVYAAT